MPTAGFPLQPIMGNRRPPYVRSTPSHPETWWVSGHLIFTRGLVTHSYKGHLDQNYGHITYSQHGEDLLIVDIFSQLGIKNPSYLDIGAFDPYHISNTALLYSRGSKGVTVDANPYCMENFKNARPHGTHLQFGVIPQGSHLHTYIMFDNQSGRNTLSKTEASEYSKRYNHPVANEIEVPNMSLNDVIVTFLDCKFPDFLSIDVEGLDYDILKHADFTQSRPIVICVETRLNESLRMGEMMKRHGFKPYVRMGENVIFVCDEYHARLKMFAGIV